MAEDDFEYMELAPIPPSALEALFVALREDAMRQLLAAYAPVRKAEETMRVTTIGPGGQRLDRDPAARCKADHPVAPGRDGCDVISCKYNHLRDQHPGRPDRPEGPPPTITREDVEMPRYLVVEGQNDIVRDGRRTYRIPAGMYSTGQEALVAAVDIGPDRQPATLDLSARPLTPADQALETLALIAEHRLTVYPWNQREWAASWAPRIGFDTGLGEDPRFALGATIGDAVRACVERIVKEKA